MRRLLNCGTAGAGLIGLVECGVLMSIYVSKWDDVRKKDNPMDSEMFALYNITLGVALVVMFYAVIYNALKSLMEVGRAPLKMMLGLVVCGLIVVSARVRQKWKNEEGDGFRDKKFTSTWEMWVLLVTPYIFFIAGVVAAVYSPSFCTGA